MLGVLGRIWGGGPVLYRRDGVEVRERNGVRTLHLDTDTVQSAMRVDRPDELELSYTRAMMAFLLFDAMPRTALLIGLGGGSMVKFIHHRLAEVSLSVVEINAEVIEAARRFFALPAQNARLRFVVGDGSRLISEQDAPVDALLIDAYDGRSLALSLATDAFFAAARAALSSRGVMAMNLWSSDRAFDRNLQRIEREFDRRCLCLPAERPGNVIVFAFAGTPQRLRWNDLAERARVLEERLGLEFGRFVSGLRLMNRHDATGLQFGGR